MTYPTPLHIQIGPHWLWPSDIARVYDDDGLLVVTLRGTPDTIIELRGDDVDAFRWWLNARSEDINAAHAAPCQRCGMAGALVGTDLCGACLRADQVVLDIEEYLALMAELESLRTAAPAPAPAPVALCGGCQQNPLAPGEAMCATCWEASVFRRAARVQWAERLRQCQDFTPEMLTADGDGEAPQDAAPTAETQRRAVLDVLDEWTDAVLPGLALGGLDIEATGEPAATLEPVGQGTTAALALEAHDDGDPLPLQRQPANHYPPATFRQP
jgi:hypothetical protein